MRQWLVLLLVCCGSVQAQQVSAYWYKDVQVVNQRIDGLMLQAYVEQSSLDRVVLCVTNNSDAAVEVQPQAFFLIETSPRSAELKPISEKELRKSIARSQLLGNVLLAFSAGIANEIPPITNITNGGATAVSLIGTPDAAAQDATDNPRDRLNAVADQARAVIQQDYLRRTTLYPGGMLTGSIFFRPSGPLEKAVLTAEISGRKFSLPFGESAPAAEETAAPPQAKFSVYEVDVTAPLTLAALGIKGDCRSIYGINVTAVMPGSSAARAKIAVGDVIVAVDGVPISPDDGVDTALPPFARRVQLTITKPSWPVAQTADRLLDVP